MLSYAEGILEGPYGKIVCRWEIAKTEMTISVVIPPNTTAKVYLPCAAEIPFETETDEAGRPYLSLGSGADTITYTIDKNALAKVLPHPKRDPFYELYLKL